VIHSEILINQQLKRYKGIQQILQGSTFDHVEELLSRLRDSNHRMLCVNVNVHVLCRYKFKYFIINMRMK
jgi:hypothetical protein